MILPFLALLISFVCVIGSFKYTITRFNDIDRTHEYVFKTYGPCDHGATDPFTLMRLDSYAKWNINNTMETRTKIHKVCSHRYSRCPVFRGKKFLSLLRNKRVGFLGDSIGQQQFEGVVNQLSEFATKFFNGTHYTRQHEKSTNMIYYEKFNVTMYFCFSSYFRLDPKEQEPCIKQYYGPTTQYVVVGIGTWFKPKHYEYGDYFHPGEEYTYNRSFTESQVLLRDTMIAARRHINTTNPSTKVIWRLHPHVGRIDELTKLHKVVGLEHTDSMLWSNTSLGAHWVPVYNDIISSQAAVFGDKVLDWYTLSNLYIDYFAHLGHYMHVDSLHYCLSGVPKGGALLLQDTLYDIVHGGKRYHEK